VRLLALVSLALAVLAGGCLKVDFAGYPCDAAHPCPSGLVCADTKCLAVAGEGEAGEGEGATGEGEGATGEGEGATGEGEGATGEGEGATGEGEGATGEGEGATGEGEGAAGEGEGVAGEGEGEGTGGCTKNDDCVAGKVCSTSNACIDDCRIVPSTCGPAEGCDPATGFCRPAVCGNGILENGEQCDNGASNSDTLPDHCRTNCTQPSCGDGVVDPGFGESCDLGAQNGVNPACSATCQSPLCGNGVLNAGEQCDNGSNNSNTVPNACRTTCTLAHCGDGVVDNGEQCDDGNLVNGDGCDNNCTITACGNGVVTAGEVCDDGNRVDGDGCDSNCTPTGCGNGIVTAGEQCDNGAANSDFIPNACRSDCVLPSCGDAVVDNGEQCDDGAANSDTAPNACRTNCVEPFCGDGVVDNGEQCDPPGVGSCNAGCVLATCGDGKLDPGEQCDAGALNSNAPDAPCRPNCTLPRCGDGVVDSGEECDDGNNNNGDGCDFSCHREFVGLDGAGRIQQAMILDLYDQIGGCAAGLPTSFIDEVNESPTVGSVEADGHTWREYTLGISDGAGGPVCGGCAIGVDLNCHFGGNIGGSLDDKTAYAFIYVYSPDNRQAILSGGSDDGWQVFLNGTLVDDGAFDCRCWADGEDTIAVDLVAGPNRLLVKSGENGGDWGYVMALLDPTSGAPFTDVQTSLSP
jgi:cysteine-rich repeat protein